jgi:hypothetical protein
MIKPIEEMNRSNLEIDLTGPKGNAFYLMSLANHLANAMCLDGDEIIKEMKSDRHWLDKNELYAVSYGMAVPPEWENAYKDSFDESMRR